MSDNLRDRIAQVIGTETPHLDWCQECGGFGDTPQGSRERWIEHLADAVIAALGLAKACQSGCAFNIPNHVEDMTPQQRELLGLRRETVGLIHRHVTEWATERPSYCRRCGIPHTTPCRREENR